MSNTETANTALWDAIDAESKQNFVSYAWRVLEYQDRIHPPGPDNANQPYMHALREYCGVRITGDASIAAIVHAADTLKQVPQHAGTAYDSLPESIRQANAIYHAANSEAKHYVLPSAAFLMHDSAHARRSTDGISLMDVKDTLRTFILAHKEKPVAQVHPLLDAIEEMEKLAQPGDPHPTLSKLDRRLLAGYCDTLQSAEIATLFPELAGTAKAFSELLGLQEQQQVQSAKTSKPSYNR